MSLFAAGWTVGSLRQLLESGVTAATYFETTGWRGVLQGDEPPSLPRHFPSRPGMVFPLYHVFADLAEWKDGEIVPSRSSNPLAIETLAVTGNGPLHLLVANLTPESQSVTVDAPFGSTVTLRRLNAETADAAASNPERYRSHTETLPATGLQALEIALAPFEIARLDALEPAAP
jgi:hypothetical protein